MLNLDGKEIYSRSRPPQLTAPSVRWKIEEELINGVITAAVLSEGQRPGIWQKMIHAINSGAAKTKDGTVETFLFRAMVDRLLSEFHMLDSN